MVSLGMTDGRRIVRMKHLKAIQTCGLGKTSCLIREDLQRKIVTQRKKSSNVNHRKQYIHIKFSYVSNVCFAVTVLNTKQCLLCHLLDLALQDLPIAQAPTYSFERHY